MKRSVDGAAPVVTASAYPLYNRHALYGYALDKRAGETKGEGYFAFGAKWYAVSATGRAVVKASTTTTTTTSTTTTNSCRYPPCP